MRLAAAILLCLAPFSRADFTAQFYINQTAGNNGDAITTTTLAAADVGTLAGSWSASGNDAGDNISTDLTNALFHSVAVSGTPYSGVGTKALEFDLNTTSKFIYDFTDNTQSMIGGGWIMFDLTAPETDNRDLLIFATAFDGSSEAAVLQLDGNLEGDFYFLAHSSTGGAGDPINVLPMTPYYFEWAHRNDDGVYVWIYNADRSLLGTSVCLFTGGNPNGVTLMEVGNCNPHGGSDDGSVWIKDLWVRTGLGGPYGIPTAMLNTTTLNVGNLTIGTPP